MEYVGCISVYVCARWPTCWHVNSQAPHADAEASLDDPLESSGFASSDRRWAGDDDVLVQSVTLTDAQTCAYFRYMNNLQYPAKGVWDCSHGCPHPYGKSPRAIYSILLRGAARMWRCQYNNLETPRLVIVDLQTSRTSNSPTKVC